MPNQQLKDRFYSLLKDSKSFQLLSAEEQDNLLKIYDNATDNQLRAGIEALDKDEESRRNLEAKLKENNERQYKLALEIKDLLRQIDREERKDNEEQDTVDSNKAAEELLGTIAKIKEEPKKRKKILGIF